jgi:hypothetical protein
MFAESPVGSEVDLQCRGQQVWARHSGNPLQCNADTQQQL